MENDNSSEPNEPTTITSADAIKLIDNLTSFLTHQENHVQVSEKFLYELKNVKKELCKSIIDSKIQMDITSFLQPTA